ncbi:MAG: FAD-dependent oxidoreductase [Planctomycetota bacterium]|nr:FAD-dependent oxidoreductase [Planctomycetota bacterium]
MDIAGQGKINSMKVIVFGAGSFGSWSAYKLLQAGCQVTLVDSWGAGNSRSSSGGETRVIRTVYGQDELYVEMARRSMDDWRELPDSRELIEFTGNLWLCGEDDSYVRSSLNKMTSLGIPWEEIGINEASKRWPQMNWAGLKHVFFEPQAGFLRARKACVAIKNQFIKEGGLWEIETAILPDISQPVRKISLTSGRALEADVFVFACGPWLKQLFPSLLEDILTISRQEVYYFGVPAGTSQFCQPALPIWLELNEPIHYGLPSIDYRGFKIARDQRGANFDPTNGDREPTANLVNEVRNYLAHRFPGLANAPLTEARVCQYANTPDGHFILDQHKPSGLVIVGGGSGHGFKMGPAIGDRVVQLVREGQKDSCFNLNRFSQARSKSTQFEHS